MGNFSEDMVDTSPLMLRGTPESDASKVQVSFQVWANPGKSALRPRKQDLHESNLLKLLGNDYDHRWMRTSKDKPNGNVSIIFGFHMEYEYIIIISFTIDVS